jgi:hypothetical protein
MFIRLGRRGHARFDREEAAVEPEESAPHANMADWLRLNWVADARLSSKHCSAQPISLGCLHGRAPHAFRPRLRSGLVLTTGYFRPALAAASGSIPPEETVSASPKMAALGPSTTTNVSPAGTGKSCDGPLGWPITTCRSVMTLRHPAPEKAHFESVRETG